MLPQIYGKSTYLSLGEKGPVTPPQKYKWLHDTLPSQQTDFGKGGLLGDNTNLTQTPAQLEATKAQYSSPDSMPKMCQVSIKSPLRTPKRTQANALLQQAW
ncbi:uncharacterized protein PGTG_10178 [Puccinia graminis f. sp. tritici CRL 75-36-700-3]|uniref:Uncharacterized protein n=1 Tax=Puccinia graminis f. sp. tritici (strain CRL 75-36-700-3 / race SCCL) TaxID=418459 RepID=E3KJI3_PUCGT|nr:uncharacterized protein PGTG_10178 [Puccinia graminis f. sp. tritici CRL 75-36-700-3]EFP84458.2 hypothetical protein PGTG_10178 [Puccinia graminis f. sp. tritici CRL 75-36-700-3]